MSAKLCIGLTGRMASGKGEAVKIMAGLGFTAISLSDIVREEAQKLDSRLTRNQMQDLGNRLRQDEGAGVLGKRVREKINSSAIRHWVIDGVRNPAEIAELKQLDAFLLIGIEANIKILIARLQARGRDTDRCSEAELRRSLEREWGTGEAAGGQQVGACMKLCDYLVCNEGSLAELENKLKKILSKLEVSHG